MTELIKIIGRRVRNYRKSKGYSQEFLAEKCEMHPTYIGQIERGERNATLETFERIATALEIPLAELFVKADVSEISKENNIPLECYEFLIGKSESKQKQLLDILKSVDNYGKDDK